MINAQWLFCLSFDSLGTRCTWWCANLEHLWTFLPMQTVDRLTSALQTHCWEDSLTWPPNPVSALCDGWSSVCFRDACRFSLPQESQGYFEELGSWALFQIFPQKEVNMWLITNVLVNSMVLARMSVRNTVPKVKLPWTVPGNKNSGWQNIFSNSDTARLFMTLPSSVKFFKDIQRPHVAQKKPLPPKKKTDNLTHSSWYLNFHLP